MPASVEKLLNSQYVQLALAALAFLIALWFVVVIARMLMGGRLRLPGGRARQARLGIVDAFDLDRQRQLIIVRRDNTEHLIMIGGPNDLLIESEIVRVEGRDARDVRDARRDKAGDGEPRVEGRAASRLEAPVGGQRPEEVAGQPMLPPFSAAPEFEDEAEAQRGPTFPLPPRRPTAPPPSQPERRPSPERVTRPIEPAMFGAPQQFAPQQPAPQQPAPQPSMAPQPEAQPAPQAVPQAAPLPPMMPVEAMQPLSPAEPQPPAAQPAPPAAPAVPARTTLGPADRPVPARPSPFLKPLPPRPPIRPLKRVTPQAVPPAATTTGTPAAPETPAVPEAQRDQAAEAPRSAAEPARIEPARIEPAEAPKDGIESLEEEMAKLLGR